MVSAEGPAFAKGDLNADGLDDMFFGGSKRQPSYLYFQQENGSFKEVKFLEDSTAEDVDAAIRDFNNDGHMDLLVVSGGNEFWGESEHLRPRLYKGSSSGLMEKDDDNFSGVYLNASKMAIADIDEDGDLDVFIGARSEPRNYGYNPKSYLMINHDGVFKAHDAFSEPIGMINGAGWGDMNMDGTLDLVVVTEWGAVKIYHQSNGVFTSYEIPNSSGLWRSLKLIDIDGDGRLDILAGNFGLNSKYQASAGEPLRMYVRDFDENGSIEQIITMYNNGEEGLFSSKDELMGQMVEIKKRFTDYTSFSKASLYEVFPKEELHKAMKYEVDELRSSIFYNGQDGYTKSPLPLQSQLTPINALFTHDFNQDGKTDLLTAGNFSRANIEHGQYDAGYGELMLNLGNRDFQFVPNDQTGLYITGEIRKIDTINIDGQRIIVFVRNNDAPSFIKIDNTGI